MILKMSRDKAIEWCKLHPNVVLTHLNSYHYHGRDDTGMSWNGTEMRFWSGYRDRDPLNLYGECATKWGIAPWSPVQARRPTVGGI